MSHTLPDHDTFKQLAAGGANLIPVARRLLSDQLTPVLAYRRLVGPDDRMAASFLLESVVGGDRIGRYSFLGARPIAQVIARDHEVQYIDSRDASKSRSYHADDPLGEMRRITADLKLAHVDGLPDFTGGWVGFAGYDTVRYLEGEKLDAPPTDDRHLPDLQMGLYRSVVAFDHVQKTVLVITHAALDEHDTADAAYAAACAELDDLVALIERPRAPIADGPWAGCEMPAGEVDLSTPPPKLPPSNMGEGGYEHVVEELKQYIAAGDIFQVVPSQRFEVTTEADPFRIYRALRVVNPSPYMFYVQIEGGMLIGSSPEILCKVEGDLTTTRPLAGTRRRGRDAAEDAALERELLADPKEQAEHIMLVDLHRNDIGRVAQPGTIDLPAVMVVERYSHVMHISSTVTGRLRPGCDCWDALRYALPVGTVSGAPKIRAMQLIDQFEPTRRGPYAGAVGFADFAGNMDMAIALRTMVVTPGTSHRGTEGSSDRGVGKWVVHLQAGAGIVADSVPHNEHVETVNKAAALAKAIDVAEQAFGPG